VGRSGRAMGVGSTLIAAGMGLMIGTASVLIFPLGSGESLDLTPAAEWPHPTVSDEFGIEKGPTFVSIEDRIDPVHTEEFVRVMADMRQARRRGGALQWALFVDIADPGRFLEKFVVESWLEHLRQHERVTVSDHQLEKQVQSLHTAPDPPRVTHYISAGRRT